MVKMAMVLVEKCTTFADVATALGVVTNLTVVVGRNAQSDSGDDGSVEEEPRPPNATGGSPSPPVVEPEAMECEGATETAGAADEMPHQPSVVEELEPLSHGSADPSACVPGAAAALPLCKEELPHERERFDHAAAGVKLDRSDELDFVNKTKKQKKFVPGLDHPADSVHEGEPEPIHDTGDIYAVSSRRAVGPPEEETMDIIMALAADEDEYEAPSMAAAHVTFAADIDPGTNPLVEDEEADEFDARLDRVFSTSATASAILA